ncbi:TetR/AcrR family transcriptional regulator [Allostreptomyces psammosilenae]|uniref:AcrR family transcriptional regulator n=1 Tax=Allostreptomyces psammosilenae TaxID=1892865 RepID=A0A853AC34_9ACTN|nr:TetR/AcrR family transcriptional regulator [Allostreptomyces psammosilenae]NYI07932.1 AcrR family transcriptional regulator [Allostreptomyces psammosilenae]
MGNREDLLAGARRCLIEKGYGRTTVRDIVAAAGGVSMAAIGYHFGSREALLNAALMQALDEWGEEVGRVLAEAESPDQASPAERAEAMWQRMIDTFATHRSLWLASVEAFVQAEHSPELREQIAAGQREGRRGMAASVSGLEEGSVPERTVRTLGSVQLALFSGVMLQWLGDPEHAPSGAEVVEGLRALMEGMTGRPADSATESAGESGTAAGEAG